MANYNTFVVQKTNGGKTVLVTSSARKAHNLLTTGTRIEVWSDNRKIVSIYKRTSSLLKPYIQQERDYIRAKQEAAEQRHKQRRWDPYDHTV